MATYWKGSLAKSYLAQAQPTFNNVWHLDFGEFELLNQSQLQQTHGSLLNVPTFSSKQQNNDISFA